MRSAASGFLGAIAVVGASAYLAISAAALLGMAAIPGLDRVGLVAVVVLVAMILPRPEPDGWRVGAIAGLIVALVAIAGAELVGSQLSVGAGQVGGVVGALFAIPVLDVAWSGRLDSRPIVRSALILIFVFVSIALVRAVLDGGALGHDESAYALKARAWLTGTPDTGWQLHRAPLNSLLGTGVIAFTESEVAIRLVGAVLAVGSLAAVGLVAARLGGRWSALVAVATVGASLPFLRRGSEYLTDVPAAGLLLLIVWVVLVVVRDPDEHARLVVWLGPLVAAAFYMRYQSALAIVGIALAAAVVWPRVVSRLRRPLLLSGGLALAALAPHLVWATAVTDRPWGVVLLTGDAAGREFLGEGLVDYARMFPVDLAGPVGALVMAFGIGWVLWKSAGHLVGRRDAGSRAAMFILTVVVVSVVPLGLVAHGEPRFVFFPVWLLIAAGSALVVDVVRRVNAPYRAMAVALAALLWLPLFTMTVQRVDRNAEARGETFAVLVDASNAIESDGQGTCAVLTTYEPQVNWYSSCSTELLRARNGSLGEEGLQGDRKYVLLFENGKRQPVQAVLEQHLDLDQTEQVPARNDRIGDATIVEISSS